MKNLIRTVYALGLCGNVIVSIKALPVVYGNVGLIESLLVGAALIVLGISQLESAISGEM